jgi:hypothetical protein
MVQRGAVVKIFTDYDADLAEMTADEVWILRFRWQLQTVPLLVHSVSL